MTCPKCELGNIISVRFKDFTKNASLCDFCETLWIEDEKISINNGHSFRAYSRDFDQELSIEMLETEDQDHNPIEYKSYK